MMRIAYCCNLHPQFIAPEPHNPRALYSQKSFKKLNLRLIAPQLAGKVSWLQQKTEAGIDTPRYPRSQYTRYRRVFLCQPFMVAQAVHLRGGRNLWAGSVNSAWAASILRLTPHGGSNANSKRLPA